MNDEKTLQREKVRERERGREREKSIQIPEMERVRERLI